MIQTFFETGARRIVAWRAIWPICCGILSLLILAGLIPHSAGVMAAPVAAPVAAPEMRPQSRFALQETLEADSGAQGIDVVVILDDSGSMATCWPWPQNQPPFDPPCREPSVNPPSDPTALRYSAARLLLQLADTDDRIAVIRFDGVADGVGLLGNLQRIGDDNNRRVLTDSLQPPTDYFRRGYTRIDLGMELARSILENAQEPGRNQYAILLTDGEPTEPGNVGAQDGRVAAEIDTLRDLGALTFPVVLCNEVGGCPAEFVREQFTDISVAEATTAAELLPVFAEIFTQMKPNRSVLTGRNSDGALAFSTRAAHGVRSLTTVTTRDGLLGLNRAESPMLPRNALNDNNISISILEGDNLGEGSWSAATAERSGFVVLTANSYPQLLNPPPSVADSAVSVRYYPAGRPPLILARGVGPGADEPLIRNNQQPLESFGQSHLRAYLPGEQITTLRLQLGQDENPLQLIRTFRLSPRDDLPRAEVFAPTPTATGVQPDGRARLQAGFGGSIDLQGIGGSVFVFESDRPVIAPGDEGAIDETASLVHQANMVCADRLCTDEAFRPLDGRTYQIYYVLQGQSDGLRFSDWTHTELTLAPAVIVGGLPATLELAQMPPGGWPLELSATTLEEIGALTASLNVRHEETGEEVRTLGVEFVGDVPMEGAAQTTLRITGLDRLRPGSYTGSLTLQARNPAGAPVDVTIRPGVEFPLALTVDRPAAFLEDVTVDFGEILFNTSPGFRLDEEFWVPVTYEGFAFGLDVEPVDPTCEGLTLTAGEAVARGEGLALPLRVSSNGPVDPGTCAGGLQISGPNEDYDVFPNRLDWQVRVAPIEWSIVSGDLFLPDMQDAGARIETTIQVRFTGEPPFLVEVVALDAEGNAPLLQDTILQDETGANGSGEGSDEDSGEGSVIPVGNSQNSGAPPVLSDIYLDIPAVEVQGEPNENGVYAVPLTLITRQGIPFDPVRGTMYNGQMQVRVAGLPDAPRTVNFYFRSPSIMQRYFAPWVVPVYSMPMLLCTGPLTLFLLLFMVARVRGRGMEHEELEQAAAAAAMQMKLVDDQTIASASEAFPTNAPADSTASSWGTSEWGSVWDSDSNTSNPSGSGQTTNGSTRSAQSDPWTSSW
ncbi:MAG: vWA domain-containing protein [Litorilinea sp.]